MFLLICVGFIFLFNTFVYLDKRLETPYIDIWFPDFFYLLQSYSKYSNNY